MDGLHSYRSWLSVHHLHPDRSSNWRAEEDVTACDPRPDRRRHSALRLLHRRAQNCEEVQREELD